MTAGIGKKIKIKELMSVRASYKRGLEKWLSLPDAACVILKWGNIIVLLIKSGFLGRGK